jgi:hypothetical protein
MAGLVPAIHVLRHYYMAEATLAFRGPEDALYVDMNK